MNTTTNNSLPLEEMTVAQLLAEYERLAGSPYPAQPRPARLREKLAKLRGLSVNVPADDIEQNYLDDRQADFADQARASEQSGQWALAVDMWTHASNATTMKRTRAQYAGFAAAAKVRADADAAKRATNGNGHDKAAGGVTMSVENADGSIDRVRYLNGVEQGRERTKNAPTEEEKAATRAAHEKQAAEKADALKRSQQPAPTKRAKQPKVFEHDPVVLAKQPVGSKWTCEAYGHVCELEVMPDGFLVTALKGTEVAFHEHFASLNKAAKKLSGGVSRTGTIVFGVTKTASAPRPQQLDGQAKQALAEEVTAALQSFAGMSQVSALDAQKRLDEVTLIRDQLRKLVRAYGQAVQS